MDSPFSCNTVVIHLLSKICRTPADPGISACPIQHSFMVLMSGTCLEEDAWRLQGSLFFCVCLFGGLVTEVDINLTVPRLLCTE